MKFLCVVLMISFPDNLLCHLCDNRVLHDFAASRCFKVWDVPCGLSFGLVCRPECRIGCWSSDECTGMVAFVCAFFVTASVSLWRTDVSGEKYRAKKK